MYKGKILISNYTLVNDLEFNKAVILIAKSDNEGTIGFILNKKSNYLLSDINSGSKELNIPIYKGGPVMIDTIHFIHKKTKLFQKSTKITNEIYWGNEFEKAVELYDKVLALEPDNAWARDARRRYQRYVGRD